MQLTATTHPRVVLERESQAFVEATSTPPFLYELTPTEARKVLDDVQAAPIDKLPARHGSSDSRKPRVCGAFRCAQGDSNSHGPNGPQGPQPCASTSSATGACPPSIDACAGPLDAVRGPG